MIQEAPRNTQQIESLLPCLLRGATPPCQKMVGVIGVEPTTSELASQRSWGFGTDQGPNPVPLGYTPTGYYSI